MQHDESIRIDSAGIPCPRDDHGGVFAQSFSDRGLRQRCDHQSGSSQRP
jgi:hypothetical protein